MEKECCTWSVCRISACFPEGSRSLCCHLTEKWLKAQRCLTTARLKTSSRSTPATKWGVRPCSVLPCNSKRKMALPCPFYVSVLFQSSQARGRGAVSINERLVLGVCFHVCFLFCTEAVCFCFANACGWLRSQESGWEFCMQCAS